MTEVKPSWFRQHRLELAVFLSIVSVVGWQLARAVQRVRDAAARVNDT
jgi:hypothetical protein